MTLFEQVESSGIEYSNHESDLYIPVNEQTRALLASYYFRSNVTIFRNNKDGKPWYDVPFAYTPWWECRMSQRGAL